MKNNYQFFLGCLCNQVSIYSTVCTLLTLSETIFHWSYCLYKLCFFSSTQSNNDSIIIYCSFHSYFQSSDLQHKNLACRVCDLISHCLASLSCSLSKWTHLLANAMDSASPVPNSLFPTECVITVGLKVQRRAWHSVGSLHCMILKLCFKESFKWMCWKTTRISTFTTTEVLKHFFSVSCFEIVTLNILLYRKHDVCRVSKHSVYKNKSLNTLWLYCWIIFPCQLSSSAEEESI